MPVGTKKSTRLSYATNSTTCKQQQQQLLHLMLSAMFMTVIGEAIYLTIVIVCGLAAVVMQPLFLSLTVDTKEEKKTKEK